MKKFCVNLGGIGAALVCIPAIYEIHRGNDAFSPVSYFLWAALSVVCLIVLVREKKGGLALMSGYFVSEMAIGLFALAKGGAIQLSTYDVFVIILVAICAAFYVWCELRNNLVPAIIINASACIIAGIPQLTDSIAKPNDVSIATCVFYVVVNFLSYYGEKPTLHGRLIPALFFFYWLIIAGCSLLVRL